MNTLRHFSVIIKLKLFSNLRKNILNIKSYSQIVPNNNYQFSKFCNCESIKNKKHVLRNKIQTSHINFNSTTNERNCCQSKNSVSLAIIGGGYAPIYSTILLKQNPFIKEIHIIDTDNSLTGPICDIAQIDTSTTVIHYKRNSILDGLNNIDIVALMDETNFIMGNEGLFSQFQSSYNYVKNVTEYMVNVCPKALIAVFAHPVTATLPLVSEIYKLSGHWNPNKIIGSVLLESMRISAMTANLLDLNPLFLSIPIAGGVDPSTIVPLLSITRLFNNFTKRDEYMLIQKLRSVDKYLSKSETRGPTLSSGLATAKFISILINGLIRQNTSFASAFVRSNIFPSCLYMTSELEFGKNGIERNFGLPKISSREIVLIEQAAVMINKIVNTVSHLLHHQIKK